MKWVDNHSNGVYDLAMSTKDDLLKSLKESLGIWVSGKLLAEGLGISRSAVWKHMKALRKEGYEIESTSRRGYRLEHLPDRLFPAEIQMGLKSSCLGRGQIEYYEETDSTNNRARNLAQEGAPEGTLVLAEFQRQGRGRRGRIWRSPKGAGIYVSVILRPHVQPHEAPQLTLLTAVAMAETLRETADLPFAIKWPNDIMVRGKKISGILTEMAMEMERIDYVVVGVGLNVNMRQEDMSPDIRDIATSLAISTGKVFSRVQILRAFLEKLEFYYGLFQARQFERIRLRWKELSGLIGKKVRIDGLDRPFTGEVMDLDQDGFLLLKLKDGTIQRIVAGDVLYVELQGLAAMKSQNTYDFICGSTLIWEFDIAEIKETNKKIKRQLKYYKLGDFDQNRINYLRNLKNEIMAEIHLYQKSKYYQKSNNSIYADFSDYNIALMVSDFIEKYDKISKSDMYGIINYAIYLYYLR
ncbi:MAG: biotin--[acetyl-CoA-carboxylase] ligase [Syntrophobacterales bacterium]|nr:biotin--[acetyl-CoA-carboxylase] ligase [Syntrophobacterales bacterium]